MLESGTSPATADEGVRHQRRFKTSHWVNCGEIRMAAAALQPRKHLGANWAVSNAIEGLGETPPYGTR